MGDSRKAQTDAEEEQARANRTAELNVMKVRVGQAPLAQLSALMQLFDEAVAELPNVPLTEAQRGNLRGIVKLHQFLHGDPLF